MLTSKVTIVTMGVALALAAGCGGGNDKTAQVTASTTSTTSNASVIETCNGRYPPDGQAWNYCVINEGAPAPDYLLHPATTEATTTTLAVTVNADFVGYARQLKVGGTDESIQTLGDGVCLFARMGGPVFHGYVIGLAPAEGLARQWFSSIMVAAALKLCPDAFSVIQPEVQHLAGN